MNIKAVVIGLVGYKQSGKTSVYEFIEEFFDEGEVKEIMLAGKLKRVCSEVFHTPLECFEKQDLKEVPYEVPIVLTPEQIINIHAAFGLKIELPIIPGGTGKELTTPRKVLQYVGTEILRAEEEWIHCRVAGEQLETDKVNVVVDIRFLNEYDYFKNKINCNFFPIHIFRPEAENSEETHSSEIDIPKIAEKCIVLENTGTLEDLKEKVYITLMEEKWNRH